jgi:GT2 family glycosyltransferase/glycosyltransferase involved in cell wall biosynthesis
MPLPAHQLLNPACAIRPAWAVFDRLWYLLRYPDARAICQHKPPEAALMYYLRVGARLGHSPSSLFDETYYLARNPDIAELVRAGNYQSGFDHFCQQGHRGVSPHWLFDDELYGNLYDDMTLENLDQHQCHGRYDHYLNAGQRECRMGQFLFDGAYYRAAAVEAGIDGAEVDLHGPYVHFLNRLGSGQEEIVPSVYFDPFWYVEHHPRAKAEIVRGRYTSAIHHYLNADSAEHLDPVPQFSERFYRRRHPDIQAAIEQGFYRSAYQQFVQYGAFELRQPNAEIDLVYYRDMHERVRNDLNSGAIRDAFAHLRLIGLKENLSHCPPDAKPAISEGETREQFIKKARTNLAIFARRKLDFSCTEPPALSVIMVLFNKFELTMLALASLRDNFHGVIELILVDNDSTDDTRRISSYVQGAKIIRNTSNIGFLRASNLGLEYATAPALLYLNNDVELGHGAIAVALARLNSAEDIGAVGAKIVRTNGLLQEAGSIIWNEGTTIGYMRDASPLAAEANFLRDVDYCSAVFLMCRAELVRQMGGFDEAFAPAYFEDADLCVRVIEAGFRIVYDPDAVVHHLEFGSATTTEASMALMRRGKRIFKKKHEAFLETRPAPSAKTLVQARSRSKKPILLFIEDTVPLRRLGSGFVRANDALRAIIAAGYEVHVFPVNGAPYDAMSLFGDLPDGVEVLHDRDFTCLPAFLEERRGIYDIIWIARTHNFTRVMPLLRQAGIDPVKLPIILDTEALAAERDATRAAVQGVSFDKKTALKSEFSGAETCREILAVSPFEISRLKAIGFRHARHLGTAREAAPTPASFTAREDLLFVGGIHQQDSPNLDSLFWYQQYIQPILAVKLGEAPLLHVVGHVGRDIDLSALTKNKRIKLHGPIADLVPFYNAARVFIAPTRFAAGTPYKIYETAAFGLPCVATDLLLHQLGWEDGVEVLGSPASDAEIFAEKIIRLYCSETLWESLRAAAVARLAQENSLEDWNARVAEILRSARKMPRKK